MTARAFGAACVVALAGWASVSWAQPASPKGAPSAPRVDRLNKAAARAVTHLGLIDLHLRERATASDARLDGAILSVARELDPDNPELVRTCLWLADQGAQPDLRETLLRRLVDLDPRDTTAVYRLISERLGRMQDAEQRVAAYERFLGAGAQLDAAVRSRLAYDASVLLRERGDETAAIAKLKVATTLDPTNKDAAVAAYEYFRAKLDDPAGKVELLGNLLMADPVDYATHDEMCRVMASGGAFELAKAYQTTALSILTRAGAEQGATGVIETLTLDWPIEGPGKVVTELNKALAVRRNDVRKTREYMADALLPLEGFPEVQDVRLDPPLERLRLVAAIAARDSETTETAANDLRTTYDKAITTLLNPPPGVAIDIDDPPGEARALRLEVSAALLWADKDVENVVKEVQALEADPATDKNDPALLEVRAWVLARSPTPEAAIEPFRALAKTRLGAHVGLATALEKAGRTQDAVTEYKAIMRAHPLTPEGAWAWARLSEITGRKEIEPELVKRLKGFAASIPSWVEEATQDPQRLMTLSAEVTQLSLEADVPAQVKVRITNLTSVSLGVGPGRTIDSRLLLSPVVEVGLKSLRQGVAPERLDLDRRLRLAPRESLEAVCEPDPGFSGWLVETLSASAVRVRWNVLQGYSRGPTGVVSSGPMCLTTDTQSLARPSLAEAALSAGELATKIAGAPESGLPRLVIATRAALLGSAEPRADAGAEKTEGAAGGGWSGRMRPEDSGVLASAFAARYAGCGPVARRLMVAGLPHAGQVPAMKAFDDVVRADPDPAIQCLFIVSRVTDANDEALARGQASADARLKEVAELHADRIAARAPMFGSLGPGLTGLIGPDAKDDEGNQNSSSPGGGVPGSGP